MTQEEGLAKIEKVKALTKLAETSKCRVTVQSALCANHFYTLDSIELSCTVTQLALAWVARIPTTSTVILGASKPEQVVENLKALDVIPKLTPEILDEIDEILGNKPAPEVRYSFSLVN